MNREMFPQFGRVAIIDDKYEEVRELVNYLSSNMISFFYLDSVGENIDKISNSCIRVIFLDLVFGSSFGDSTVKSMFIANINRLIKENNGPYTIAIWSTRENEYMELINSAKNELNYIPEDIIYLNKANYQTIEGVSRSFSDNIVDHFKECRMLQFISLWENHINHSIIEIVSKLNRLIPEKINNDTGSYLASNLSKILLDKKNNLTDIENEDKIFSSYEALNILLGKEANLDINQIVDIAKSFIIIKAPNPQILDADINTMLWIEKKIMYKAPKNAYIIPKIDPTLVRFYVSSKVNEEKNILLLIDITSKCDFVQDKIKNNGHQFVYGIMFDKNNYSDGPDKKKNKFSLYIGNINYMNTTYEFFVLLNAVVTKSEDEINISDVIFSLSDDVYQNIRSSLGLLYNNTGKYEFN